MNGGQSVVKCKKIKTVTIYWTNHFPSNFQGIISYKVLGWFFYTFLVTFAICTYIWQIINKHQSTSPQMGQSPESVVLIPSEEICSFCSFIILFDIPRGLRLTFEFLLRIALSSSSLKSSLISKRVVKIAMNGLKRKKEIIGSKWW